MNRRDRELQRRLHQVISLRNLLDEAIRLAEAMAVCVTCGDRCAHPSWPEEMTQLDVLRRRADAVCESETGIIVADDNTVYGIRP